MEPSSSDDVEHRIRVPSGLPSPCSFLGSCIQSQELWCFSDCVRSLVGKLEGFPRRGPDVKLSNYYDISCEDEYRENDAAGVHLNNILTQVSLPLKQKQFHCFVNLLSIDFESD